MRILDGTEDNLSFQLHGGCLRSEARVNFLKRCQRNFLEVTTIFVSYSRNAHRFATWSTDTRQSRFSPSLHVSQSCRHGPAQCYFCWLYLGNNDKHRWSTCATGNSEITKSSNCSAHCFWEEGPQALYGMEAQAVLHILKTLKTPVISWWKTKIPEPFEDPRHKNGCLCCGFLWVCMCICVYVWVHIYVHVYIKHMVCGCCVYRWVCMCMCVCMCEWTYMCIYAHKHGGCVCECMCIRYMCVCVSKSGTRLGGFFSLNLNSLH